MGGLDVKLRLKPCKWCKRPIKQGRWGPKRYCNRWHQVKYRVVDLVDNVLNGL